MPNCVAVAIGLIHFSPTGRIVEVCGDAIRRLFVKSNPWSTHISIGRGGEPYPSVAFFGVVRQDEVLLAIGHDGIYRIGPDGKAQSFPLPTIKQVGAFSVSFEYPGIILVGTMVNQRRSMSGLVPTMVVR